MHKQESILKGQLMTHLQVMKGYLALRHEDVSRGGIPDISVTGYNMTSWWEVKHATPLYESPGLQELTCNQLASAGFCRYILYYEKGSIRRTLILHPKKLHDLDPEVSCNGFDHEFVAQYIREIHERGTK